MSELKQMIPGKTVIATGKTRLNGEAVAYTLYYGNVVLVDGGKAEFNDRQYREKLDLFFKSPDGENYVQPTEEELADAYALVHNLKQKQPEKRQYTTYSDKYAPVATQQKPVEKQVTVETEDNEETEEKSSSILDKLKKKKKKEKAKKEPVYEEPEEDNDDEDDDEYYETGGSSIATIVLSVLVGILAVTTGLFGAMTFGVVNNPFVDRDNTVAVAVLNKSVKAGEQIHTSDLEKEYITEDEYNNAKGTTIINKDGTQETDKVILWSNKDKVENAYALSDISEGNQLMLSDFSGMKATDNWITLNMDGQEVKIAASLVEEGQTEIRNYLIVTSKDSSGAMSSYAIENGSFTLKDKNLIDVKDANGSSILEKIVQKEE